MTDEDVAKLFHEAYERLAPSHGYKTREASAKPWSDLPEQNRALMTATCREVRRALDEQLLVLLTEQLLVLLTADPHREQTAATILAALTVAGEGTAHDDSGAAILDGVDLGRVRYAVALADALRGELAKGAA